MTSMSLAIPSKGRLKEQSEQWLASAGFKLRQLGGGRGYSAEVSGLPDTDVMLLSAREIAEGLISGDLHVGVTGEDLLHDLSPQIDWDAHVLQPLGFGAADVVVAVPQAWLDVDTMADLEAAGALFRQRHGRRMRVATKYLALTRRFFASRSVGEYRLVESAGATEAAPATGSAEVIVDITSTGATLQANHLKVLSDGVILRSQAVLAGSLKAKWSDAARASLRTLLDGMTASAAGRDMVRLEVSGAIPPNAIDGHDLVMIRDNVALCRAYRASETARLLSHAGAGTVTITTVNQVYGADSVVFDQFVTRLS